MTGYRRVRTCGEPCSEGFECPSCVTNGAGASWCTGSTYNTVCPSTVVATVAVPTVSMFMSCYDHPDTVCSPFTVPQVNTSVTLTGYPSAGDCSFKGHTEVAGAWSFDYVDGVNCDVDNTSSWEGMFATVWILPWWLGVAINRQCSAIIAPCGTDSDSVSPVNCKGMILACTIGSYNHTAGTDHIWYGFADAYKASDVGSCTGGTTLCWNEMSAMKNFSSNVFCLEDDTWWSTECCDAGSYYARSASGTSPSCASYADTMSISIA